MNNPIVLITEPLSPGPLAWLAERADARVVNTTTPSETQLAQAQGLIVRTYTQVDAELLDRAPELRVVARAGAGVDNIDIDACRSRGIPVVYTPEANTGAVAEFVLQTMLAALRPLATINEPLDQPAWTALRKTSVTDRSCVGTRLGLIGLGKIGKRVARAAVALGMEVVYYDIEDICLDERCSAIPVQLDELLETSGVVSLHVDARPENHHMIGSDQFSRLRADVMFINAARGSIVDPNAASAFARANPDARLILDVHDPEPFGHDYPLLNLPNVTLYPHIGAGTKDAKEQMSWVVRDVMRVLQGEPPHHQVDW
ncbi:MAG: NAD(P)-dependent oxidoreductase [Phycisphaerales bacterium JB052]